jgi:hypothetical protein
MRALAVLDSLSRNVAIAASSFRRCNAKPDQVVSGKFGQNFAIDVVFEERIRILFEPQAAQPVGDLV